MEKFRKFKLNIEVHQFIESLPPFIIHHSNIITKQLRTTLVFKGEKLEYVYVILDGIMTVLNENAEGKLYSWLQLRPFTIVGDLEILAEKDIYAANVGAITNCTLLKIKASAFIKCLNTDSDFKDRVVRTFAINTFSNTYHREYTVYLDGYEKVGSFLVRYCSNGHGEVQIEFPMTVKETRSVIAGRLGISSKTVNRGIDKLKTHGLIELQSGKIVISKENYILLCEKFRIYD